MENVKPVVITETAADSQATDAPRPSTSRKASHVHGHDPLTSRDGSEADSSATHHPDHHHHRAHGGTTSANSSLTSESGVDCVSEGGYRSSNEGTPERTRTVCRSPSTTAPGQGREEKTVDRVAVEGCRHHSLHHAQRQRSHPARLKPVPVPTEEDSDSSPPHPSTRQHTEEGDVHGHSESELEKESSGGLGGGDTAASTTGLNPDGTQQHLFQRVYPSNRLPTSTVPAAATANAELPSPSEDPSETQTATPTVTISAPQSAPRTTLPRVAPVTDITTSHTADKTSQYLSPASAGPVDVSSSSSIGGHHLSVTLGRTFMKQSGSRREERFYAMVQPYQDELVRRALARWCLTQRRAEAAAKDSGAPEAASESPSSSARLSRTLRSNDEELDEFLAEVEAAETHADGHGCPLPPPGSEERAAIEAQWWREKPKHYKRSNVVAFEAQRKAFSSSPAHSGGSPGSRVSPLAVSAVASETAGNTPPRPPPPPPPLGTVTKALEQPTPNVSAAGTPHSGARLAPPAAAADGATATVADAEMEPLFELPPDSIYSEDRERALRMLAPFIPRFRGIRRIPMKEVVKLTGNNVPLLSTPLPSASVSSPLSVEPSQIYPKSTSFVTTDTASNKPRPMAPTDADNENSKEGDEAEDQVCQMIALEDVCYGFAHPCVLDMKMGQRQYGMHPTPEKKKKKEYRCKISTSGQYGIRLAGFRWWNEQEQTYESKGKRQCRSFSLAEVKEEMAAFFQHSRALERKFGEKLEELRVTFAQQNVMQFFTSSLLFVYDADHPLETCRLVMVDFAFTYERKELALGGDPGAVFEYDIGYLRALDTLLALVA